MYSNKKVSDNLYQYEMGTILGAEIETKKKQHQEEYGNQHTCQDEHRCPHCGCQKPKK